MEERSLGINNISGTVLPELGNLTKLISLSFSSNNFTGALPKKLGNLVSLEQLYIDSSGESGEIPQLANLKSLKILWASDNRFTGSFSSLTKLDDLRLGDLTSSDSSLSFLENFTNLSILIVRNRRVAGQLPGLGNFPKLRFLVLSFNKLTVKYFNSNLVAMDVSFNPITGNVQGSSCSSASTSFSVNCGGKEQKSALGIDFYDDSETLGASSSYNDSKHQWAVSNTGYYISNPNGPQYIATTDSQILGTLIESELHKTARISPSSLSARLLSNKKVQFWGRVLVFLHQILEELLAPATVAAVLGFIFGATPWLKSLIFGASAPLRVIQDSIKLLGDGTIPCITLILGGNLTKGIRSAKLRPLIIICVIIIHYVILPIIGVGVVSTAGKMGFLSHGPLYQYVLLVQYTLPPAMNIGTMTQLFDVGQEECSVLFLWTYLVAAMAVTAWSTFFLWILSGGA
ncbi:hypothetical protein ACLOJK_024387 [Asimina triloba]